MSAKLITLIILSIFTSKAIAQSNALKVTHVVNPNKSVDFNYEKTDPGTYTVVVNFSNLTNTYDPEHQRFSAKNYSGHLRTLSPSNKEQGIGFSYKYTYIRGQLNPKYNADFVYLLPLKKGKKAKVAESSFVNALYFGNTTPADWKVYRFFTETADTVTAVRKGIVVDVKDIHDTDKLEGVTFNSTSNDVVIEHVDGTLATYKGFKKGSIVVQVGQTVFPGVVLGVNSQYSSGGRYNISLSITYLKSDDFNSNKGETLATSKSMYGFVTPHFSTAENANLVLVAGQQYTAGHTTEVVAQELTKKELKQFDKLTVN